MHKWVRNMTPTAFWGDLRDMTLTYMYVLYFCVRFGIATAADKVSRGAYSRMLTRRNDRRNKQRQSQATALYTKADKLFAANGPTDEAIRLVKRAVQLYPETAYLELQRQILKARPTATQKAA